MDTITREISIAAPTQRVWDVITRAEHLTRWFPDGDVEIDLRPGGLLRLTWKEHGTGLCRIEAVEPHDLFSFRWSVHNDTEPGPGNQTLVEFRLHPDGDGTRLVVTESGFDGLDMTGEELARHRTGNEDGWRIEIGELVEYLARVPA